MRLHLIPDHFYRFYTLGDVIKGVIMLVVMHVLLTPFIIWAVQFFIYGHYRIFHKSRYLLANLR